MRRMKHARLTRERGLKNKYLSVLTTVQPQNTPKPNTMQTQRPSAMLRYTARATAALLEKVQFELNHSWPSTFPDNPAGSFTLSTPLEVWYELPHRGDGSVARPSNLQYFVHRADGVVIGIVRVHLEDDAIQFVSPDRRLHAVFTQAKAELELDGHDDTTNTRVYEPRIIDYGPLHFKAVWMHSVDQESEAIEDRGESTADLDEDLAYPVAPPFPVDYLPPGHPSRFSLPALLALLDVSDAKRRALFAGKPGLVD